jgi:hypothetical protein
VVQIEVGTVSVCYYYVPFPREQFSNGVEIFEDWRLAVGREIRADMWYQNVETDNGSSRSFSHAVEAITASSNRNGNHPKVNAAAV